MCRDLICLKIDRTKIKPIISDEFFVVKVAERQGFEPWSPCGLTVFKTVAFDHSAISPYFVSK